MVFFVTARRKTSGRLLRNATPYSTVEDAMEAAYRTIALHLMADCWIEDVNGKRVAGLTDIRSFCFEHGKSL